MIELTIAMVLALLIVCFLLEVLASYQRFILEHLAVVLFGAVIGLAACSLGGDEGLGHKRIYFLEFSEKVFFMILAPPIFLEAGFRLNRHMFFNHTRAILALGLCGTYVSVMLFAAVIYYVLNHVWNCGLDVPISFQQCVRLGAIFTTTDATALLRIFSNVLPETLKYKLGEAGSKTKTGVLTSIVIGESLANNGVSLLLFQHIGHTGSMALNLLLVPLVFILSCIVGILLALVCSKLTKHMDMARNQKMEFLISISFAILSYFLFIEVPFVNPLVSLYSCGFAMAHYNFKNISQKSKVSAKALIFSSSWASFTFIYFQMGIIFAVSFYGDRPYWNRALPLATLVIMVMLACRGVVVATTSGLLYMCGTSKLGIREQVILNLAGIRGAVSYALCLVWRGKKLKSSLVTTTTLGVVLFTNIVLASALYPAITGLYPDYQVDATTIIRERRRRKSSVGSNRGLASPILNKQETPMPVQNQGVLSNSREATPLMLPQRNSRGSRHSYSRMADSSS
mmetsp:Transcript_2879/g.4201  ORF Transcript_2879/g.4201 Transcript_2879/m.4201 type:complete len:512 (-) Transcript_2879:81-1616(-)